MLQIKRKLIIFVVRTESKTKQLIIRILIALFSVKYHLKEASIERHYCQNRFQIIKRNFTKLVI